MPVRIPAITSGSTDEPSAVARGPASTTSSVAALVSLAACVRSCATAGLAADAVSTFGALGVATKAPYTSRSSIASRAAASSP